MNVILGQDSNGPLFVVGRTSPHGGYSGFACLLLVQERTDSGEVFRLEMDEDYEVPFRLTPNHPSVTWFTTDKRREVLGLMARYPKRFERCEMVRVDKLEGYGSPIGEAIEGVVRDSLGEAPASSSVHHGSRLDASTRCKLATSLSRSSRTDLLELARFTEYLGHRKEVRTGGKTVGSETEEMILAEIGRRQAMAKEALERIWLEPIGPVTYAPAPAGTARGTKPQPGDE